MLLRELFYREAAEPKVQDFGRPFNHPEHLVFFYGTDGALEALQLVSKTLKVRAIAIFLIGISIIFIDDIVMV